MSAPRSTVRTVTVVASCLALLAALVVVGVRVYGREPTVTLLANWTGEDQKNFEEAVIAPFESKYHIRVDYQGSSAESQVLSSDVEAGTPPDVVVLTGPGELAAYVRQNQLKALEGLIPKGDFSESWATPIDGHVYWFPLKADLKSIVWHPGGMTEQQIRDAARQPGQWCLGMGSGATSGWPGTDWIEDILLQQSGWQTYQKWARGEIPWDSDAVRNAWKKWGSMVGAGRKPDDLVRRALLTDYQDASAFVTKDPRQCSLEHQASFIRNSSDSWKRVNGQYVASSRLLGKGDSDAWEVSGDLVALLHATPQAKKLIGYLASAEAQRAWSAKESGFSVDAKVPLETYGPVTVYRHSLATALLDRRAVHCFDASDAMPPTVRDAFAQATIEFLARPGDLGSLLKSLDTLGRKPGLTWLPSVCDRVPPAD
ncbi:ABC transporter substrate-binding protein [Streptomyces sp. NPDC001435]|uniref:ABC transporter substrate-binding protein n=1 Tax=Streptomyces sp. NPDC001435 TaxID=3364576 RepID=UPI0036831FFF